MAAKLCVIFDIDETLIHFIDESDYHVWENTSEKNKTMLDYKEDLDKQQVYIFRPFLKELFSFFMNNRSTISVGLWTYADAKYAAEIGDQIIKRCNLPKDFFRFIYSIDEISGRYPKDLRYVYGNFPEFNISNTFLVDNLASNVTHEINQENGMVVPSFAPYGFNPDPDPTKNGDDEIRNPATSTDHAKAQRDHALRDIVKICKKVVRNINDGGHVFSAHHIRKMALESYFKTRENVSMTCINKMPSYSRSKRSSATATFTQNQNTNRKNNADKAIKTLTAELANLARKRNECEEKIAKKIKLHGKAEIHMRINHENHEIDECENKAVVIMEKINKLRKSTSKIFDIKGGCTGKSSKRRKTQKAWRFW